MSYKKEEFDRYTLYCGDCLEILPELSGVDSVITDPPYSSGARTATSIRARAGMTRGEQWKDEVLMNDRMTTTGFVWMMRHVAIDCAAILSPGGSFLSFIDWRQYPQLYGAIETSNLRIQNLVVWDKEVIGMGNGFRNRHELIIHASNGVPNVFDKGTANIITAKRISSSDIHPTEKPESIYLSILPVISDKHHTILDPFMGSGTTGVACANLGRKFIGIEIEPKYYDIARRRISDAYAQGQLFEPEDIHQPEQQDLGL